MLERALHYPEWSINNPLFLAESLLFWDQIACMVPYKGFHPEPWHEDSDIRKLLEEAHERFIYPLVPTSAQKQRAHSRIVEFASHEPPEWCKPDNLTPSHKHVVSAYKFDYQTMDMLRDAGWVEQYQQANNLELQVIADSAAHLMLGALAEACSTPTLPPVTDDPGSFSASCNLLLEEIGAPTGITSTKRRKFESKASGDSDYIFLMSDIPYLGFHKDRFNPDCLRRIIDYRDKPEIDEQRKAFRDKIHEYQADLRGTKDPNERDMIAKQFRHDLDADLVLLKRQLRTAGLEALISKDGICAILLGVAVGTVQPHIGLALGLAGEAMATQKKRQEAYDKHWSSWIMSTSGPRLGLWGP